MDLTPLITELSNKADILEPLRKPYEDFKNVKWDINTDPEPDFYKLLAPVRAMGDLLISQPKQRQLAPIVVDVRIAKPFIDPNEEFFFI